MSAHENANLFKRSLDIESELNSVTVFLLDVNDLKFNFFVRNVPAQIKKFIKIVQMFTIEKCKCVTLEEFHLNARRT